MRVMKVVSGGVAAMALMGGLAISEPAAARDRLNPGAAAALGVLGGLAVGGAIAASQAPVYAAPVYAPPPPPPPVYYAPEPVYYAPPPPPLYRPCFTERSSEWVPGWGWQPSRRTVCR